MEVLFLTLMGNHYLKFLIIVIVLDIIAGTTRAIIQKRLNSSIGTVGLLKHMLVLITISILTMFAPLFELGVVANTFIGFYIFQYGLSIVENWEAIGLPVPGWVKQHIKNKKREYDENDNPINQYMRKDGM